MGKAAAELLFGMIDGSSTGTAVDDMVLTPSLVVRRSTAAPVAAPALPTAAS